MGLGKFDNRWIPWYFLRFPIGIGLALLVYLIIRGGFLTGSISQGSSAASTVNPFGIAAIAALTGMFSREAVGQLDGIFASMFGKKDSTAKPAPVIADATIKKDAATASWLVNVKGTGFDDKAAMLLIGQKEIVPSSRKPTELTATLSAAEVGTATTLNVKVRNPPSQTSNEVVAQVT
jgi:hypothetical protein